MNENLRQFAKPDGPVGGRSTADGHRTGSTEDPQEVRGLIEEVRGFIGRPAVDAAITGAVVAAVVFNIPEALLGAAVGVAVHAIRQRRSAARAKGRMG
jgi:hypothetical protein